MAQNGISTLATKELRQKAKLDLVALKRQGNVLNNDGTVYSTPLGSAEFNGDNYLATAGGAGTAMGTGDFTWECWVRPTTSSGYQTFIDTRGVQTGYSGSGIDGAYFGLDTDTLYPVYYQATALMVSSIAVTQDDWTHVALVRNSGTTTLYVGGVTGGTYADSSNLTGQYVNIGATFFDPGLGLTGQISNLRIVKGTAVYTADFTPPTVTLTAVEGTQLLLLNGTTEFVDGSNNQFTITSENGDVTLSTTAPALIISAPFYRTTATYDVTQLPTQYSDNDIIDNPNVGGLVQGRPWAIFIGMDDPANAAESDATAWVLMDGPFYNTPGDSGSGFVGGQSWRKMEPAGTTNGKTDYIYGDERVYWDGANWLYENVFTGTISTGTGGDWPWEATWTDLYTAAKITAAYIKTTNYPAVP